MYPAQRTKGYFRPRYSSTNHVVTRSKILTPDDNIFLYTAADGVSSATPVNQCQCPTQCQRSTQYRRSTKVCMHELKRYVISYVTL